MKKGRIHIIQDDIDLTESDNLVEFEIEDNCYVNDKFIGTTIAKKIKVNIINPNDEIDLEDKEISVFSGIELNTGYEELEFGNFIIEKPDTKEVRKNTSFVGYDYMIKFNATYHNNCVYPTTARNFFERLCMQVGLQAGNKNFINSDFIITENPFEERITCKSVLSKLAELAGGFAYIGRDNKVYIVNPKNIVNLLRVKDVDSIKVNKLSEIKVKYLRGNIDMRVKDIDIMPVRRLTLKQIKYLKGTKQHSVDFKLNKNNYLDDFAKNKVWGELNSLTVTTTEGNEYTTTQDLESIGKYGLTELVIENNPFIVTKTDTEKISENMWKYLKYFKYLPFETKYYGYPYVDSGDVIYITDTKDNRFVSYIFNHTFKFNGAYSGNIETQALTKAQVTYKNTSNLQKKLNKVENKTNDISKRITRETSSIRNDIQEIYTELTEDKVGNSEIIAKLNQTTEEEKIDGNKISFEGKTININDINISGLDSTLKEIIQSLIQRIEELEGDTKVN